MGAIISYFISWYTWLFPGNLPKHTKIDSKKESSFEQSFSQIVGKVSEFRSGEMKECDIGEGKVLLIRDGDKFFATGSKCTHYKVPLKNGVYHNGRIRCPWHGACFSAETGDIEDFPGIDSLPTFPVEIVGDDIHVRASPDLIKNSCVTRVMKKRKPEDERVFVIVGAGAAGATAVETLRAEGFTGRIILIGREKHLPYDRPKLSKVMNTEVKRIQIRNDEFYEKHDIELILGTQVTELDSEAKTVSLSNGTSIKYDSALVCSGADPQRLAFIPNYNAPNVYVLRNVEESTQIFEAVDQKNVAIVGSSFIGMETAACIVSKAKSVTVIGMEKVPFERVLGFDIGLIMQKMHEENGIQLEMNAICQEFKLDENGMVNEILLKNGKTIPTDIIVIGAGVVPCTSFIKPSKTISIGPDKSIKLDAHLFTGADGLYAAGDIARFPLPLLPNENVRIEHWGMSQIQGQIAARNMLQGDSPSHTVTNIPFFWTQQYGKSLRYCGHALRFDEVVLEKSDSSDPKNPKFVAYYVFENRVLAACSMNFDPIVSQVSELMNAGKPIRVNELKESLKNDKTTKYYIEKLIKSNKDELLI